MAETPITLGDGQQVIPDWAKEKTLADMLSVLETLAGVTKKSKEEMAKIAAATKEGNAEEGKSDKALLDAIKNVTNDDSGTKIFGAKTKSLGLFQSALAIAGTGLTIAAGALSLFGSAVAASYTVIKGIGDDLREQAGGTGLDIAGPMGDAALFRTSMQMLGYSADQVSSRFEDASKVIAVAGRDTFVTLTREIQSITGAGSDYTLSLAQLGDALDDDLKLRQAIGILNMLDGNKQAKRSAELYAHQLKATTLLGKSIDSIAGSADDTLTGNASIQLLLQSMGEGAHEFTTQIQKTAGDLAASGLSQGVNNAIQNAMLESVAFRTDAGGELFAALTVLDKNAGTDLISTMQQINALSKTDPDAAALMMDGFAAEMINGAKRLTPEQLQAMRPVIENFGELGKQLLLSIGQFRQSKEVAADFSDLAKAAATVDNAFQKFRSGIAGTMSSLLASFGRPLSKVMDAFTKTELSLNGVIISQEKYAELTDEQKEKVEKNESLFGMFNIQIKRISDAFKDLFDLTGEGGGKMKDFAMLIKNKIEPLIKGFGDEVVKWIEGWTAEKVEATIDNIIFWFKAIGSAAATLGGWLAWFIGKVVGTSTKTNDDGVVTDADGNPVEVFSLYKTIMKAVAFAFLATVVKNAIAGAFGFGMSSLKSLGGGLISKIPGMGGLGQGAKAAKMGTGFGAGAVGMAAFGVAAAGVGVALLGISTSIEKLGAMDWEDAAFGMGATALSMGLLAGGLLLLAGPAAAAAPGLLAISVALLAVGAAAAGIGVAAGGIAMLVNAFGDTSEEDIAEQDATTANIDRLAGIDRAALDSTAAGITGIAVAMVAFGDATNDRLLGGPDLNDQVRQLGIFEKFAQLEGSGLIAFSDGMNELIETINRFNAIDTAKIVASAEALGLLNEKTQTGFGERIMDTVDNVANRLFGNTSNPVVSTAMVQPISPTGQSAGPGPQNLDLEGKTSNDLLMVIAANTQKTFKNVSNLKDFVS